MRFDGGQKQPLTASRYNDRWPFLMTSNFLAFSLWSYNPEVLSADERTLAPCEPGAPGATRPVDTWLGAFRQAAGDRFGALLKYLNVVANM